MAYAGRPTKQSDISAIRNEDLDYLTIQKLLSDGWNIFDLPFRVAAYCRVSTDEENQLHSLRAQQNFFYDYIEKNPNWTICEIYYDEGITGTSTRKRKGFLRMMEDASMHKFNLILTKEVSRFARNLLDSISCTRALLRQDIGVFFLSDNLLTFDADSELRLSIMSSLAQEESRKTSNRVRWGQAQSLKNGVVFGSNRFYGYRKENGKLIVDPDEAEMVRLIFDLYGYGGFGLRRVARELWEKGYKNYGGSHFTSTTIKNILRNEKYTGVFTGGKTHKRSFLSHEIDRVPEEDWIKWEDDSGETVPAIIDKGLFELVQKKLDANSEAWKSRAGGVAGYRGIYSYSSLIVCGRCGKHYCRGVYRNKRKDGSAVEREFWRCINRASGGKNSCSMPRIQTAELDSIILALLQRANIDLEQIIDKTLVIYKDILSAPAENREKRAELFAKLNTISERKEKLLDLAIAKRISDEDFEKRNSNYIHEEKELRKLIAALEAAEKQGRAAMRKSAKELRGELARMFDLENGYHFGEEVVSSVLERITVKDGSTDETVLLDVYIPSRSNPLAVSVSRSGKGKSVVLCDDPPSA
ncbi:MAG: recombinase family protein [Synergistaceae bacterium]|nr:recombinase family protein [Synergistaceae bacterium]